MAVDELKAGHFVRLCGHNSTMETSVIETQVSKESKHEQTHFLVQVTLRGTQPIFQQQTAP